jgi:hypothetical protein
VFKSISLLVLSAAFSVACAQTSTSLTSCSQMGIGQGASLNGFIPFPVADPINQDISSLPVSSDSSAIIGALGSTGLHPDFGAGTYDGVKMGQSYEVVGPQALVPINYTQYGSQSDPGPMPIPANAPVEGGVSYGDRHVFILSQSNCFLYELWTAVLQSDGSWDAGAGAVWDLLNDNARPYTWTSADAAGLPMFPLLVRYDEVAAGAIHHAVRFTLSHTRDAFIAPATHQASSNTAIADAPMGTRFRLKASYDISGFTPQAKIVLQALKTYGMIVADNGSNMFIQGTNDSRWNNDDLHHISSVPASAFEVVNTGPIWTYTTLPHGDAPVISSLTSTASSSGSPTGGAASSTKTSSTTQTITESTAVTSGTAVTISWETTGASYFVLTPGVGAVRGNSAVVKPTQTTTYTLYANNHFGSTTKSITITVQ